MTPEIKEAQTEAEAEKQRWEAETLQKVLDKTAERKASFEGVSLEPVERLYTEADVEDISEIGFPASSRTNEAFTRPAIAESSGRCGSLPGFSSPENTNRRFKYLLEHGQTGLSVAYDLPALMGLDAIRRCLKARSANAVWPSRRLRILRFCSTEFRSIR